MSDRGATFVSHEIMVTLYAKGDITFAVVIDIGSGRIDQLIIDKVLAHDASAARMVLLRAYVNGLVPEHQLAWEPDGGLRVTRYAEEDPGFHGCRC